MHLVFVASNLRHREECGLAQPHHAHSRPDSRPQAPTVRPRRCHPQARERRAKQLDKALLWSEPLARGWNVYLKAVRTDLPNSPKLRELGICTVALLTDADYGYMHYAPDFLTAGGTQAELDALNAVLKTDARQSSAHPALDTVEQLVIRYAAQMTLDVKVTGEVFNALREHFDTAQIVELTSAIATYNMVARFLVALGVSPGGVAKG